MSKEVMKLALEALECTEYPQDHYDAITALREALAEQPAQQEPVAWTPIDQPYPPGGELDILMGDGSILCEVLPQADGDLWWGGASTGERFIDPKYASVTHWRIHAEHTSPPAQRTWVNATTWRGLTDEDITDIWYESKPYYNEDDFARAIEAKLKEKNT